MLILLYNNHYILLIISFNFSENRIDECSKFGKSINVVSLLFQIFGTNKLFKGTIPSPRPYLNSILSLFI